MNLASLFTSTSKRKPPKRKAAGFGTLEAYQRTYGEKDGRTVFEAAQIKAKRRGKR